MEYLQIQTARNVYYVLFVFIFSRPVRYCRPEQTIVTVFFADESF